MVIVMIEKLKENRILLKVLVGVIGAAATILLVFITFSWTSVNGVNHVFLSNILLGMIALLGITVTTLVVINIER